MSSGRIRSGRSRQPFFFRVKPRVKGGSRRLLDPNRGLERHVKATDYELLDLLPADLSYRHLDLHLDDLKKRKRGLRDALATVKPDYDAVLLDCPPGLTLLAENVFRAADPLAPLPADQFDLGI